MQVYVDFLAPGVNERDVRRALQPYGMPQYVTMEPPTRAVVRIGFDEALMLVHNGQLIVKGSAASVALSRNPAAAHVFFLVEECNFPITGNVLEQAFSLVTKPTFVECQNLDGKQVRGVAEFSTAEQADQVAKLLNTKNIYPDCCKLNLVVIQTRPPPPQLPTHRGMTTIESPIILVMNVPEHVPLQSLWVLMEVFGNVFTLKRQFSARHNVVAGLSDANDVIPMIQMLHDCPFYGSRLSLKPFTGYVERGNRSEWNCGPPTEPSTLAYDFSGAHHRHKLGWPTQHMHRPSPILVLGNLTYRYSDEYILELIGTRGITIMNYERSNESTAHVQLKNIGAAVIALTQMHGISVGDRFLRVTFAPMINEGGGLPGAPEHNNNNNNKYYD